MTLFEEGRGSNTPGWRQRLRESRLGTLLVLAGIAGIVMVATYYIDRPLKSNSGVTAITLSGAEGAPLKLNAPVRDFTATTVDGKVVSLRSLRGHPIWLTFGASWCAACQAEAPDIEATYEKFKSQGVVVLSVFISESDENVRDYADRVGLTFLKVADPQTQIASAYRVLGIPTNYYIDSVGILRAIKVGSLNPERMELALKDLIK